MISAVVIASRTRARARPPSRIACSSAAALVAHGAEPLPPPGDARIARCPSRVPGSCSPVEVVFTTVRSDLAASVLVCFRCCGGIAVRYAAGKAGHQLAAAARVGSARTPQNFEPASGGDAEIERLDGRDAAAVRKIEMPENSRSPRPTGASVAGSTTVVRVHAGPTIARGSFLPLQRLRNASS